MKVLRDHVKRRARKSRRHAVIDVIAGAIDAWLEPQKISMQSDAGQEGVTMIGTMMKPGCATSGGRVTREDAWKSVAVMLGGTLLLTALWMALRSLKGRSPRTQSIFIGGMILVLTLIFGTAGWIGSKI